MANAALLDRDHSFGFSKENIKAADNLPELQRLFPFYILKIHLNFLEYKLVHTSYLINNIISIKMINGRNKLCSVIKVAPK